MWPLPWYDLWLENEAAGDEAYKNQAARRPSLKPPKFKPNVTLETMAMVPNPRFDPALADLDDGDDDCPLQPDGAMAVVDLAKLASDMGEHLKGKTQNDAPQKGKGKRSRHSARRDRRQNRSNQRRIQRSYFR